jgi:hypothetical protein
MSGKKIPPPCRTDHLTGEMVHGATVSPVSILSSLIVIKGFDFMPFSGIASRYVAA